MFKQTAWAILEPEGHWACGTSPELCSFFGYKNRMGDIAYLPIALFDTRKDAHAFRDRQIPQRLPSRVVRAEVTVKIND